MSITVYSDKNIIVEIESEQRTKFIEHDPFGVNGAMVSYTVNEETYYAYTFEEPLSRDPEYPKFLWGVISDHPLSEEDFSEARWKAKDQSPCITQGTS